MSFKNVLNVKNNLKAANMFILGKKINSLVTLKVKK